MNQGESGPLWPLGVYFACVLAVVGIMVGASYLLGQRRRDRSTGEPYESGIVSAGSAGIRFTARFYLMAALFLVFDMETVFVLTWAAAARELGWRGYLAMFVFVAMLAAALAYLWRSGALESSSRRGGKRDTSPPGGARANASSR